MNQDIRDDTLVVIPALDEAGTVTSVVKRVRALGFAVVVVDDGSADATAASAAAAGAFVLRLAYSTGAWIAMQTGIRYALVNDYRYVVTLDADGQHDPAAIPRLISAFYSDSEPNVVIGACTARGSRGRKLTWRILRTLGGLQVKDLTSGYRIYDRGAMEVVTSPAATLLEYQDVGVLMLLKKNGARICEIDVRMEPRALGKSRVFYSWPRVLYYLAYSLLVCTSKTTTANGDRVETQWSSATERFG